MVKIDIYCFSIVVLVVQTDAFVGLLGGRWFCFGWVQPLRKQRVRFGYSNLLLTGPKLYFWFGSSVLHVTMSWAPAIWSLKNRIAKHKQALRFSRLN